MIDQVEKFAEMVPQWIGEKGVFPTPGLAVDAEGGLEFYANAVSAHQIMDVAFARCKDPNIVEQVVAIDSYTQPDQGTELDSCLVLFHIRRGQPARVGIIEYSWNGGEPVTKPVNWENEFWTRAYKPVVERLTRAIAPTPES